MSRYFHLIETLNLIANGLLDDNPTLAWLPPRPPNPVPPHRLADRVQSIYESKADES